MMVYVLIGQTLSGKTTLAKELTEKLGIKQIITYTDRPQRHGEINGVDYHFVESSEIAKNEYFGHRFFYTTYREEPFIYAMKKDDILTNEDKIIIADPKGFRAIKDLIGRQAVSVLINTSNDLIRKRAIQRGDSLEEVERRLRVDRDLFISAQLYCDVVLNPELDDLFEVMKLIIKKEVTL